MKLDETEVNGRLRSLLGRDGDNFQQAWLDTLEVDPQTLEEITPIARRVRNRAIKQYWNKRSREVSLYKPIGKNGDERFTLESILAAPPASETTEESGNGSNDLFKKIVGFLMGECISQRNENLRLKSKEIEFKAERLRLREERLRFERDRYESWKTLMEEKGRQKENRFKIRIQLQRERLELRKQEFDFKKRRRTRYAYYKRAQNHPIGN